MNILESILNIFNLSHYHIHSKGFVSSTISLFLPGPGVKKNNAELENERNKRSAGKETKTGEESTEVEECYKQVKTLIESYNYLKASQTTLTEKCSELEEMGQKVQQQIMELKSHLTQ